MHFKKIFILDDAKDAINGIHINLLQRASRMVVTDCSGLNKSCNNFASDQIYGDISSFFLSRRELNHLSKCMTCLGTFPCCREEIFSFCALFL